jgi:hypothetical protein
MVKNHDANDVRGLEDVFRSEEFSRPSGATGGGSKGITVPEDRDDALLRRMFGHASATLRDFRRDDGSAAGSAARLGGAAAALDTASMSPNDSEMASSGGGAAVDGKGAAVSAPPPWKRESGRYWTIAAFSALVALVVAGVTADNGQHAPSNRSAQGAHGTAQPHGRAHTPHGPASTAPTAPGSLTGGVGSAALALGTPSAGTVRSGNEPAGHVTLSGAATTTGTPPTAPGRSSGGGSPGGAPGSSGTNPTAPGGAAVGSTVDAVGSSVTDLANQLGSAVPTAAPATTAVTNTVSGVLNSIDQAVSPTQL